jgi:predicted nucleic acid-binding protein
VAAPLALLDACILYPAQLRSLFMHLAAGGLYQTRWTNAIHEEWIRNLLTDHREITRQQADRIRELMDAHVLDAYVTGYEVLNPTLELPDAEDRHVLAAAIKGGATVIVTLNLTDFPQSLLTAHNVEAIHPDEFIMRLIASHSEAVIAACKRHRATLKKPAKSAE